MPGNGFHHLELHHYHIMVENMGARRRAHRISAISPRIADANVVLNACNFTNRILGYINAPAIWQHVASEAPEEMTDLVAYQEKRDLR